MHFYLGACVAVMAPRKKNKNMMTNMTDQKTGCVRKRTTTLKIVLFTLPM